MSYIIGTGWWCSDQDDRQLTYGDDSIRGKDFASLWLEGIKKYTNPQKIIVVDSASPIKSDLFLSEPNIEYVDLLENGKHATNIQGKYCGWSRGVLTGIQYALFSGVEYFVYIEQDALIKGEGIIEQCISTMSKDFMFGDSKDFPQPLQQSFFILNRKGMEKLLHRYLSIPYSDAEISCEIKFALCSSPFFSLLPKWLFKSDESLSVLGGINRKKALVLANIFSRFDRIPFGFGRDRPIDFSQPFYYFQHGSEEEINQHHKGTPEC